MTNKTVMVAGQAGQKDVPAERFAGFCMEIDGRKHKFSVTRVVGTFGTPVVTHDISGGKVCDITASLLMACTGHDKHKQAGRISVELLVKRAGADRVGSVLRMAEGN